MLTKRQIEIFQALAGQAGEYIKAGALAEQFDISSRTIQNDLKAIKDEAIKDQAVYLVESKVPFGTRLVIKNAGAFQEVLASMDLLASETDANYKEDRIYHILHFLIQQQRPVSIANTADYMFISKSTLLNDLKEMDKILCQYGLQLVQNRGMLHIAGLERDKRMCLIDITYAFKKNVAGGLLQESESSHMEYLRRLLMDELAEKQYPISDVEFQNLIIWLNVTIQRLSRFFTLGSEDIDEEGISIQKLSREIDIAERIFENIERRYLFRVPEQEVRFLALYLNNHKNIHNPDYISEEINAFVLETLEKIREHYPTDFTHDLSLRMSLAIHCTALLSRARNNVQIKNEMLDYIKPKMNEKVALHSSE